MERLAIHLALHGTAVLVLSLLAGLCLYRTMLRNGNPAPWHLVHSAGSTRGILLMAVGALIHLPELSAWQLSLAVWLMIGFGWASMLAMIISAVSGVRGFGFNRSPANNLAFILYVLGVVAVSPSCALLVLGLFRALV